MNHLKRRKKARNNRESYKIDAPVVWWRHLVASLFRSAAGHLFRSRQQMYTDAHTTHPVNNVIIWPGRGLPATTHKPKFMHEIQLCLKCG